VNAQKRDLDGTATSSSRPGVAPEKMENLKGDTAISGMMGYPPNEAGPYGSKKINIPG
jgi:hypothetical protein